MSPVLGLATAKQPSEGLKRLMSIQPDGHEPSVAFSRQSPDSLVQGDISEEDGVEHPEPPSWLANSPSAQVATDREDTTADAAAKPDGSQAAAPAAGDGQPADEISANDPTAYSSGSSSGHEDAYDQRETSYGSYGPTSYEPTSYGETSYKPSSYGETSYGPPSQADTSYGPASYGQEGPYMSSSSYGYGHDSGYPAGTGAEVPPPPPPYPAQSAYQPDARDTAPTVRTPRSSRPPSPRRRANLVLARLEPWSVMKFSFLISLVAWVVLFVAVALLYFVLSQLGVFHAIQSMLTGITSSQGSAGFDLSKYISASKILGYTMLLGAVNIVLITALSTIGAMIYNLVTHLGGGIEVTLRETD